MHVRGRRPELQLTAGPVVWWLAACGHRADVAPVSAPAAPSDVVVAFARAVERGDTAGAEALCEPGFWSAGGDSGQDLFGQAAGKHLVLTPVDSAVAGDRAVATTDVVVDGRAEDRIYLYARQDSARWLLAGVDESEPHAAAFLAGQVDARFDVAALPSTPELEAVGIGLLDGSVEVVDADRQRIFDLGKPHLVGAHGHAATGRGALVFEGATDELWVYVARDGSAWRWLGYGYGFPSVDAFLAPLP